MAFLNHNERIGAFISGIGAGKSYILAVYLVLKALKNPGAVCAMASRDYSQLILALAKEVDFVLSQMGLKEGTHFTKVRSPKLIYTFKNKSTILGLSALNYDSSFRGLNLQYLVLDEASYYDEEAFLTALGRCRLPNSQIRVGSTPQGYNYLWRYFIEKPPLDCFTVTSTTYENFLLDSIYVDSLKQSYPDRLFRQECLGEFVDLTASSAYYAFDKEIHVGKVDQDPFAQVWCGLDFNVSPLCSVLVQVINNQVRVFDEIVIDDNADTHKFCTLLKSKYGNNVNIVPDSTGANRSTVGPSNHAILVNAGFSLIPSRNPFVFDRVMAVNKMLQDKRILIDSKCKHLIRCLSKTVWNRAGKLDQSKDRTLTHSSDSFGYFLVHYFPISPPKYSSVDRSSSVLIESNQNY